MNRTTSGLWGEFPMKLRRFGIILIAGMLVSMNVPSAVAYFNPDDTHWWYDPWQIGPLMIDADGAWDPSNPDDNLPGTPNGKFTNPGKKSIIVAIIDDGFDPDHEDLIGNNWISPSGTSGKDFYGDDGYTEDDDPSGDGAHGTQMAGIIGAVTNNDQGVAGMAQVRIMHLKIFDNEGIDSKRECWESAIYYAVDNGADVISMSIGRGPVYYWENPSDIRDLYEEVYDAIAYAAAHNVVLTSGTGNFVNSHSTGTPPYETVCWHDDWWISNKRPDPVECGDIFDWGDIDYVENPPEHSHNLVEHITYPSDSIHVLAVGASDDFYRASYSYWGEHLDVLAPGGAPGYDEDYSDVTCLPNDDYDNEDDDGNPYIGTSMSTAYVSGVAALVMSARPDLSADIVKDIIMQSCDDVDNTHNYREEEDYYEYEYPDNNPYSKPPYSWDEDEEHEHDAEYWEAELPVEGWDKWTGWGIINAHKAVILAMKWRWKWSEPTPLNSVYQTFPDWDYKAYDTTAMHVDAAGYTHLLYIDQRGANPLTQVYYRQLDPSGATSVSEVQITDGLTDCAYPDIWVDSYIDANNNLYDIHMTWKQIDTDSIKVYDEALLYQKYEHDMSSELTARIEVRGFDGSDSFLNPQVVSVVFGTGYKAYIVYSMDNGYDEATQNYKRWGIEYSVVGANGGDFVFQDEDYVMEAHTPSSLDIDWSYHDGAQYVHVVWTEFNTEMDVRYRTIKVNAGGNPANDIIFPGGGPVDIRVNDFCYQLHPSIDVQAQDGYVHIVYEHYLGQTDSRDVQEIEYCVLAPDMSIYKGPIPIGQNFDHRAYFETLFPGETNQVKNGKWFPKVAYSSDETITIVWREWFGDYDSDEWAEQLDGINNDGDFYTDERGYFSVYYKQFLWEVQTFYSGEMAINEKNPRWNEEMLVMRSNHINLESADEVLVASTDSHVPASSSPDYDLDGHIRVVYQLATGSEQSQLKFMTTREAWQPAMNYGNIDGLNYDPDIDIDINDDWHMAYTSEMQGIHGPEIYYINQIWQTPVMVSGNGEWPYNSDEIDSVNPRLVTTMYAGTLQTFIYWIDYQIGNSGIISYAAINTMSDPTEPGNIFMPPTPNGPVRVPFTLAVNPEPRAEDKHEIILEEDLETGELRIHMVYRVTYDEGSIQGAGQFICHGSMNLMGGWEHMENIIAGGSGSGLIVDDPSMDVDLYGIPHVVYMDRSDVWSLQYDVLIENIVFNKMDPSGSPMLVDMGLPGLPDIGHPDIKLDRAIPRNSQVVNQDYNGFSHIVWADWDVDEVGYAVSYSKYNMKGERVVDSRDIHPEGYRYPFLIPDPELAITSIDEIAVIWNGETLGYQSSTEMNLFYALLDNNGCTRTTNTMLFKSSNMNWVVNSALDITSNDQVFCVWDEYDPSWIDPGTGVQVGRYTNTVFMRYHQWCNPYWTFEIEWYV